MDTVYTFWEGNKPDYIKLCMRTWRIPYILLTYDNVNEYTDIPIEKIKRFSMPQIADIVRVHVLRDNGGYWLDADTIMIKDELPDTDLVGDPVKRKMSAGLLHTEAGSDMYKEWARYQDEIINGPSSSHYWALFANAFADPYAQAHKDIRIAPITNYWPETYMIKGENTDKNRHVKYDQFYFNASFTLTDIWPTSLLMLHNAWTPKWYKALPEAEILKGGYTMSNILSALL